MLQFPRFLGDCLEANARGSHSPPPLHCTNAAIPTSSNIGLGLCCLSPCSETSPGENLIVRVNSKPQNDIKGCQMFAGGSECQISEVQGLLKSQPRGKIPSRSHSQSRLKPNRSEPTSPCHSPLFRNGRQEEGSQTGDSSIYSTSYIFLERLPCKAQKSSEYGNDEDLLKECYMEDEAASTSAETSQLSGELSGPKGSVDFLSDGHKMENMTCALKSRTANDYHIESRRDTGFCEKTSCNLADSSASTATYLAKTSAAASVTSSTSAIAYRSGENALGELKRKAHNASTDDEMTL
ncbi:unnamed protein product [Protopolystoma xenopodis]|uniref:Uncharacterized protein n=1 Tax=Protopolystoma xenopodis TaxID=117903 RepID=A0A3S5CSV1_9PLAT|nr:unnamed protein product [Protopolystoma xenopodis]